MPRLEAEVCAIFPHCALESLIQNVLAKQHDVELHGVCTGPAKAEPEFVVDPNAVLPGSVASERFKSTARQSRRMAWSIGSTPTTGGSSAATTVAAVEGRRIIRFNSPNDGGYLEYPSPGAENLAER